MKIDRVTLTGADDSIDPKALFRIAEKFPFVEWGILLSNTANKGDIWKPRFPTEEWLRELESTMLLDEQRLRLSGHICGRWVRQVCKGNWEEIFEELGDIGKLFQRFQLNFHCYLDKIDEVPFLKMLNSFEDTQFIFQLKDVNAEILDIARSNGIDAVPFFDLSGGAGVLPEEWPEARDFYCGYAGGLSPDNLTEQLALIEKSVGDRTIWIDAETHVRSEDNKVFDLEKVEAFLEIAKRYVE